MPDLLASSGAARLTAAESGRMAKVKGIDEIETEEGGQIPHVGVWRTSEKVGLHFASTRTSFPSEGRRAECAALAPALLEKDA